MGNVSLGCSVEPLPAERNLIFIDIRHAYLCKISNWQHARFKRTIRVIEARAKIAAILPSPADARKWLVLWRKPPCRHGFTPQRFVPVNAVTLTAPMGLGPAAKGKPTRVFPS